MPLISGRFASTPKVLSTRQAVLPQKFFASITAANRLRVFESTDLVAQSIAFDSKGTLYVATSPDGKVYRVSASGEKSVFFDPKTKYIWDIAFGADGNLYVATGDKGQVFSVTPDGKGELFYASDEAHIRVLAFDANKNLLAGTEPNGRVLRITRPDAKSPRKDRDASVSAAEGFVLYETSKREITSLAVAPDGSIYVAAIGEKQRAILPLLPPRSSLRRKEPLRSRAARAASPARFLANSSNRRHSSLFRPLFPAASTGSPLRARRMSCGLRAMMSFTRSASLRTGAFWQARATAVRFWPSMATAFSRNSPKQAPRKSPVSRAMPPAKFFCVPRIPEKFSLSAPSTKPKALTNRARLTRNFFRNGDASIGGGRRPRLRLAQNPQASSGEPRLEFFVRSGNTEDPGQGMVALVRPVFETRQRR